MTLTGKRLPRINRESASRRGRKRREGNVLEMEGMDCWRERKFHRIFYLVVYMRKKNSIQFILD